MEWVETERAYGICITCHWRYEIAYCTGWMGVAWSDTHHTHWYTHCPFLRQGRWIDWELRRSCCCPLTYTRSYTHTPAQYLTTGWALCAPHGTPPPRSATEPAVRGRTGRLERSLQDAHIRDVGGLGPVAEQHQGTPGLPYTPPRRNYPPHPHPTLFRLPN